MNEERDVIVIGAGPAGWTAAASLASRGLGVSLVAPTPEQPWRQNFGVWAHEVADNDVRACFEATWACPMVVVPGSERALDARYARLSTPALQGMLRARAADAGVRTVRAAVSDLRHDATGTAVGLADGTSLRARVVVDASGAQSAFVARTSDRVPAVQTAVGWLCEVPRHPFRPGEMLLMDWTAATDDAEGPPSFLYAMPLGADRLFVEETSLAARPAVPFDLLRGRLGARLARLGIQVTRVVDHEHCWIPMGTALPRKDQRTIGFGAAASMVHPATGYQIARVLAQADPLADAVLAGLSDGPDAAAARAWHTLWPADRVRAWELYTFGLTFLTGLDTRQVQSFFRAFFALSDADWQLYLSGTASSSQLARIMRDVFLRLDADLRWRLVRLSAGPSALPLLHAAAAR